jgi:hypothetical protein
VNRGRRLELEWSERQDRTCLRILGWTQTELRDLGELPVSELSRRLAVFPRELLQAGVDLRTIQPIAGHFEVDQDLIYFIPRFPFLDGMGYALLVHPTLEGEGIDKAEVWAVQRPSPEATPTTEVVAIYPSADQLPVNLLRFYVQFSGPMSEDWATRSVHVRRADSNQQLEDVFVPMEPELWDPERRRLTILLDPGRVKRGLAPNEEAGYPLVEGVAIIVSIDSKFRDAAGFPLRASVERRYEIGPPVRLKVNPAIWRYRWPAAGSTDPLTVEFDRSLDHALLQHSLWVSSEAGEPLAGRVSVDPGERRWRFRPESPWKEGRYQVMVDPRLEDLAGNSLIRVFDRDLTRAEDDPNYTGQVAIDFTCPQTPTPLHPNLTSRAGPKSQS